MKCNSSACLLVAAIGLALSASAAETFNGIAALVGKTVITYDDVRRLALPALQNSRARYAGEPNEWRQHANSLQKQVLESLITRQLILQEFNDLKVNIPEPIIEDRIEARIKEVYGDRVTMTKTLQEQGINLEDFRREERERLIEGWMVSQNIPRDILISPGRIERYYREHEDKFKVKDQVRMRLITIDRRRFTGDAVRLGREIIRKLDEGADFAEMASLYSEGAPSRSGGLRSWEERSSLRDEIAEVAFSMAPGQHSDLLELQDIVCIIKVEDLRPAYVRPLDEVREDIERQLRIDERARLQREWLERLEKKTFVRRFAIRSPS